MTRLEILFLNIFISSGKITFTKSILWKNDIKKMRTHSRDHYGFEGKYHNNRFPCDNPTDTAYAHLRLKL